MDSWAANFFPSARTQCPSIRVTQRERERESWVLTQLAIEIYLYNYIWIDLRKKSRWDFLSLFSRFAAIQISTAVVAPPIYWNYYYDIRSTPRLHGRRSSCTVSAAGITVSMVPKREKNKEEGGGVNYKSQCYRRPYIHVCIYKYTFEVNIYTTFFLVEAGKVALQ